MKMQTKQLRGDCKWEIEEWKVKQLTLKVKGANFRSENEHC